MTTPDTPPGRETSILILAGGRGSRMQGKDKGLVELAGKPCIEHVLARLGTQTPILISANRNLEQYRRYGFPVIVDSLPEFPGPLAGFVSALDMIGSRYLLTVPVDAPFLCPHYAQRMKSAIEHAGTTAAVAEYNGRMEPVFSILRHDTGGSIRDYLQAGGRSVSNWLTAAGARRVDFADCPEQFINLNEPADLQRAERHMGWPA